MCIPLVQNNSKKKKKNVLAYGCAFMYVHLVAGVCVGVGVCVCVCVGVCVCVAACGWVCVRTHGHACACLGRVCAYVCIFM